MIDLINIAIALLSIAFGAIGWLAPRYTMDKLDMRAGETTMALGEIRAASGALFVGLGVGALLFWTPIAFAMIGCAWGGAAIGRLTSLIVDGRTSSKIIFFVVEALVGIVAIAVNVA